MDPEWCGPAPLVAVTVAVKCAHFLLIQRSPSSLSGVAVTAAPIRRSPTSIVRERPLPGLSHVFADICNSGRMRKTPRMSRHIRERMPTTKIMVGATLVAALIPVVPAVAAPNAEADRLKPAEFAGL